MLRVGPEASLRSALWAGLLALPLLFCNAQAETLSQGPKVCIAQLSAGLSDQSLRAWLGSLADCQDNAAWLAALGRELNRQGRYREASEHLERALMLEPDLERVRVDYAVSLAGQGDLLSARGLIAEELGTSGLTDEQREALERRLLSLDRVTRTDSAESPWRTLKQVGLSVGRDSNLMAAPNLSSLSITLGDVTQDLPLDASYLPRPGSFIRTEGAFQARRVADGLKFDLLANLRQRTSPGMREADSDQHELVVEASSVGASSFGAGLFEGGLGGYGRLSKAGLHTSAGTRYQSDGIALGLLARSGEWGPANDCELRLGGEHYSRHYGGAEILSGRYQGLAASSACTRPLQAGTVDEPLRWTVGIKAGLDTPNNLARPGGASSQMTINIQVRAPMVALISEARGALQLDAEHARSRDQGPYSNLLEGGALRFITKSVARLEYQRGLPQLMGVGAWQGHLGVEWVRHNSNLALFGMQGWATYVGARASW